MSYGWNTYVPVAKRKERAAKKVDKLREKGKKIEPVAIQGRTIARTFWGKAWCQHIELFSDYDNRLPRGRTYVRNGSVCHLSLKEQKIEGIVSGSELYKVRGEISSLSKASWKKLKSRCSGQVGSMLELLQGKLSDNIMAVVTDPSHGLFPQPREIQLSCDCPDGANLCKHLAAVLYGIGARLDQSPELLFSLRGVDQNELVSTEIDIPSASQRRRITGDISDVFGINVDQSTPMDEPPKIKQVPRSKKATKKTNKNQTGKQENKKSEVFRATGPAVRRLRKQLAMNKTEFAQFVGVSASTITNWEGQRGKISLMASSSKALTRASKLSAEYSKS